MLVPIDTTTFERLLVLATPEERKHPSALRVTIARIVADAAADLEEEAPKP